MEVFEAAIDELHMSFGVLRRLSRRNFDTQMGYLTTWVSIALTNEDICVKGFEGGREKIVNLLRNGMVKVGYIMSNALALVNKLVVSIFEIRRRFGISLEFDVEIGFTCYKII